MDFLGDGSWTYVWKGIRRLLEWNAAAGALSGLLLVLYLSAAEKGRERANDLLVLFAFTLLWPLAYLYYQKSPMGAVSPTTLKNTPMVFALCGVAVLFLGFLFFRRVTPWMSDLTWRFRKKSRLERASRTDIREIHKHLPKAIKRYDSTRYMKQKRGLFVGLDVRKRPVCITEETFRESHGMVTGTTRVGKGVAIVGLLWQVIRKGESVVVLDPKGDTWAPHVLHEAANRFGRHYRYIDLRPSAPAQFNLFQGMTEEEMEEAVIHALGYGETGEARDFYRRDDRRAIRKLARYVGSSEGITPAGAFMELESEFAEEAKDIHGALEEIADLRPVNGKGGLDMEEALELGSVLYFEGSMSTTRVQVCQRFLLIRLLQIAAKRARRGNPIPIVIFCDEFKKHISKPVLDALGMAAGWGVRVYLAFQSLGDLADVPADLSPQVVRGQVIENCRVRLAYRVNDSDTAKWLAENTGKILIDEEVKKVDRNVALGENVRSDGRMMRQAERNFVDLNMFLTLPPFCGVLWTPDRLPAFCTTSPISVERSEAAITPVVAHTYDSIDVFDRGVSERQAEEERRTVAQLRSHSKASNDPSLPREDSPKSDSHGMETIMDEIEESLVGENK